MNPMSRKKSPSLFPEFKTSPTPGYQLEMSYIEQGLKPVAGVDEAGRGPLAGPVVAAAVVLPEKLPEQSPLWKVRDSKSLSPEQRRQLYEIIAAEARDLAWAMCSPREIDRMNILAATLEAMIRAVSALDPRPGLCLVDGNQSLPHKLPSKAVIKGDAKCLSIAAASIVAKCVRDQIMDELDRIHPGYGFKEHKGYATATHKKAVRDLGPSPAHRLTFRGVKELT